uniref:Uncharacterized protein n=1 Tax=Tetradesmus obliquus TaxID=3088 RepID=A0A383WDB7_TETOB|eukprot:jgi/Sobl393_1/3809/SZX75250.1
MNSALAALPASRVAEYSALLPLSQHITRVELTWDPHVGGAGMLRAGCDQHMFAAGRQLPQLKQLVLGAPASFWDWAGTSDQYAMRVKGVGPCLGEGSLSRLVSCCPGPEQLWIAGLMQPGAAVYNNMKPLLRLTALRELCVGGRAVNDDVACFVLARLSSLQRLGVFAAGNFTDEGLRALTRLQQLQHLEVVGCGISAEVSTNILACYNSRWYDSDDERSIKPRIQLKQQDPLPPV